MEKKCTICGQILENPKESICNFCKLNLWYEECLLKYEIPVPAMCEII